METSNTTAQSAMLQNSGTTPEILKTQGSEQNNKTSFIQRKEIMISKHVEELANNNKSWFKRVMLNKDDKHLLKEYADKQQEAVSIILTNQNKALNAISSGQATMVKEVVNTLLKTGRAGLKASSDVIFTELRNQRARRMEQQSIEFYDLIEAKFADAERRKGQLQDMKIREIDHDLKKWEEDYKVLLDEFSDILREQV